jgi:hypothetical protein
MSPVHFREMAETVNASSPIFKNRGIDLDKLAAELPSQGAKAFDDSWSKLLDAIEAKGKSAAGSRLGSGKGPRHMPQSSRQEHIRCLGTKDHTTQSSSAVGRRGSLVRLRRRTAAVTLP